LLVFFFLVEFIRISFLAGRKMFLAAANKPIFLSNPYPFRAEYQSKPMLKSLSIIDRERWSEWLFKHYVICLCVKWRADTWTWWWWFGAAWVPRDGSHVMGPFCIYGRAHVTASTDHLLYYFPAFLFGATDAPCSVQFSACPRIRVS
jgi:hypothetical protein